MRRWLIVAAMAMIASLALAEPVESPYAARIRELVNIQQQAIVRIQAVQEQIASLHNQIENEKVTIWKAEGAIQELKRLESEVKPAHDPKTETPKTGG